MEARNKIFVMNVSKVKNFAFKQVKLSFITAKVKLNILSIFKLIKPNVVFLTSKLKSTLKH